MLKKAAKLLVTMLILLELSIIAISNMPTGRITVEATLQNDMAVVFVDPVNVTADVGESFTISVKIFNVSANFRVTDVVWKLGEPLPPEGNRYNYSLGYLYSMSIGFRWDPTILEYTSHTVTVPVEDNPGGILHKPIIEAADLVNAATGTYLLQMSSQAPAVGFNAPNDNATVFTMTFNVKKNGKCALTLTNSELPTDLVGLKGEGLLIPQEEVPHWAVHGQFQTSEVLTRIESIQAGALAAGTLYDPVIQGEDVTVRVNMKNDGLVLDTYNLSLYEGESLLQVWEDEQLDVDESKTFSFTIEGADTGIHTVKANATILHESNLKTDEISENFTVVDTPNIQIGGPSSTTGGQTVSFSASGSSHSDPNGQIVSYTWTFWAPGLTQPFETEPRQTKTGESVSLTLSSKTTFGEWTAMLVVKDNYGITAVDSTLGTLSPASQLLRPAAAPYRATATFTVQESAGGFLSPEWIALIIILIVVIALAVFYLRRRSR